MGENHFYAFSERHLQSISNIFKKLYDDEVLTDVTLHCKEGSLKAHRLILASCSSYFHKIFSEHTSDHPVLIFHGIQYGVLKSLMDFIYTGYVDPSFENIDLLYELAQEFNIYGAFDSETAFFPEKKNYRVAGSHAMSPRGLKRPNMDGSIETLARLGLIPVENEQKMKKAVVNRNFLPATLDDVTIKQEDISDLDNQFVHPQVTAQKLTAWARKQRKFKCELCPSSFKRSSHLARHQLVHTGERPYACNQCDKAFSRHDKLKHHIRKTHESYSEFIGTEMTSTPRQYPTLSSSSPSSYAKSNIQKAPVNNFIQEAYPAINSLYTISRIESILAENLSSSSSPSPAKKQRGRPRKYPPPPVPLVKRSRGRPRIRPVTSSQARTNDAYDVTHLPYGDLEYLTGSLCNNSQSQSMEDPIMIEPLVQIETDNQEESDHSQANQSTREESIFIDTENEIIQEEEEEDVDVDVLCDDVLSEDDVPAHNNHEDTVFVDCGAEAEDSDQKKLENSAYSEFESKLAKIGECTITITN